MDPLFISSLAAALWAIANKLAEKAVIDPALEKGLEPFRKWLTRGYDRAKSERALYDSFVHALANINISIEDPNEIVSWFKKVGLDRLQASKNTLLREEVALTIVRTTTPDILPP